MSETPTLLPSPTSDIPWQSIPLSQATTLCGDEADKLHQRVVKMETNNTLLRLPTLSYFGRSQSHTSTGRSAGEQETSKPSRLQSIRANDWMIVLVCAYCLFYQIFACTLFSPVIPSRLEELGIEAVEENTGYLSSIWAAGCVVASPIAGWLPTVYQNKRIQLLVYVALLIAATLLFAFVPSVAGLMAGRMLHGIGASGSWTVAMALLNDSISQARLGRMTGLAQVGYALGNSASPTIGGSVYDAMGWHALCYFALGMGGLNILLCLLYVEKVDTSITSSFANKCDDLCAKAPAQRTSLIDVIKISVGNPKYFVGIAVGLCWGAFSNGVLYTALSLRLEDRYSLSSSEVGFSFLAIAGPNVVFAPLAGWLTDRLGARPLMLACIASFALWNGLMCIDALPYPAFLVILFGVGASASFIATPLLVHWTTVDRLYGSPVGASLICGIYSTAVSVSCLVFPLISGAVLGKVGISLGWKILLGLLTACLLACLSFMYRYMRLPEGTRAAPEEKEASKEDMA